jgi:hypothetical protein
MSGSFDALLRRTRRYCGARHSEAGATRLQLRIGMSSGSPGDLPRGKPDKLARKPVCMGTGGTACRQTHLEGWCVRRQTCAHFPWLVARSPKIGGRVDSVSVLEVSGSPFDGDAEFHSELDHTTGAAFRRCR